MGGKEGLGLQGLWVDPQHTEWAGKMGGRGSGCGQSPDDGCETVNQKLFLLLRDGGPLVRGFFLRGVWLFPDALPLWQLPGAGRDTEWPGQATVQGLGA